MAIFMRLLALLTIVPALILPGRIAVCLGNCAETACSVGAEAEGGSACCCDCCEHEDALFCGALSGPRKEDRPACPACVVLGEDSGPIAQPSDFEWTPAEPIAGSPNLGLVPPPCPRGESAQPDRVRDPRDPPPRRPRPLRI